MCFFCAGFLRADLVSYWTLDGNLKDSASAGSTKDHGEFVEKAVYGPGKKGKAIVLDGSNFVTIPHSEDLNAMESGITIVAWFQLDARNEPCQVLLSKGKGNRYQLSRSNTNCTKLSFAGGWQPGERNPDISGGDINDGQWHHVIAISGGGGPVLLFVDGKLVASRGPTLLGDSSMPLMLGANPEVSSGGQRWIGAIDDVGIFSRPITELEALAIWKLTADDAAAYDLRACARLLQLHWEKSTEEAEIGGVRWEYSPVDRKDGSSFIQLSKRGSGVSGSGKPVIIAFETSAMRINSGTSADLRWAAIGGDAKVEIVPPVEDDLPLYGRVRVTPDKTTNYALTVRNAHGSATATVRVYVDDPSAKKQ